MWDATGDAAGAHPDPLHDPHRLAAARRLLVEVSGPTAFDRIARLAARLVGARHAQVTIVNDGDTVVGSAGLPPGAAAGSPLLAGAFSEIVVRKGGSLRLPDALADPCVADLPAVASGEVRAYLGTPLVAASGHVVGALAVYDPVPRPWADDDAELLLQLAVSVTAELELSAARSAIGSSLAQLEVALEASSIGIWENDLVTGTVTWDERCAALFGLSGAVHFDTFDELMETYVHPDDHAAVVAAMETARAEGGQYTSELRALRADGAERWMVARGRIITDSHGEPVRILGTMLDVTDARRQAAQRLWAVQRTAAIAEVAAELANATRLDQLAGVTLRGAQVLGASSSALAVLESDGVLRMHLSSELAQAVRNVASGVHLPPQGVAVPLDDSGPTQYVARRGARLLFSDRQALVDRFPGSAESARLLEIRALAALPLRVEGRLLGSFVAVWSDSHEFSPDDIEVLEALAAQIGLSASRLLAATERTAAVAAMTQANQRLQLLADAGRLLSSTLDISEQLERLASLVVPSLGDWCWIVATDDHGQLREAAAAHRDPARQGDVAAYLGLMLGSVTDESAARTVYRTGQPLIIPALGPGQIAQSLSDPEARALLQSFDPVSVAAVPLAARGETLGVLCLLNGTERGPHTPGEIETALEIGRRAGVAVDQARLYGQQRELADALQRSMLTAPPEPDHCQIAVRYVPAAEGAEIGGDWYDAFLQEDGATVLAIGDVAGHDTRAAAAMGQVRGLLRGIGFSSGGSPAEILTELDRALQGLDLDLMATALVGRLEESEEDLRAGRTWFRWASAGHPAPVLIDAEGNVELLDATPVDLMLGVAPRAARHDRVARLGRPSTVLLYTDGLVERRDRDVDTGTAELMAVLREHAALPLEELCDVVLERLFLPDAEDDVAILAVRLHPQGAPRPVTAGHQQVPPGVPPSPDVHVEARPDS
jgi:PAS domain S-box-containing protein